MTLLICIIISSQYQYAILSYPGIFGHTFAADKDESRHEGIRKDKKRAS